MKHLTARLGKIIVRIISVLLMLVPGVATSVAAWPLSPAVVAVFAGIGVEFVVLMLWAVVSVTYQSAQEKKKRDSEESE